MVAAAHSNSVQWAALARCLASALERLLGLPPQPSPGSTHMRSARTPHGRLVRRLLCPPAMCWRLMPAAPLLLRAEQLFMALRWNLAPAVGREAYRALVPALSP